MSEPDKSQVLEIRKYPNRRYYDSTRRCHVTLEDIHGLIVDGWEVRVTDSKTGEDITGKVLAQIILDFDPMKLSAFPSRLLHQLIRSNERLVRDFVDKYFSKALGAFLDSQRQFEAFLRQSVGLGKTAGTDEPDWSRLMFGPFSPQFWTGHAGDQPPPPAPGPAAPGAESSAAELRQMVEQLQQQVRQLARELDERKA